MQYPQMAHVLRRQLTKRMSHSTGYELREGLTPANYGMKGSPAGLARIDALFGGHGYTLTFTGAPMVFGAFPSLHAGHATIEALFCSYFFPLALRLGRLRLDARVLYWGYTFWLYWCTMYLMHHYLIDVVAGACLATTCFYCECDPKVGVCTRAALIPLSSHVSLPHRRDPDGDGAAIPLPECEPCTTVRCASSKPAHRSIREQRHDRRRLSAFEHFDAERPEQAGRSQRQCGVRSEWRVLFHTIRILRRR